jgi:hypothetical protein
MAREGMSGRCACGGVVRCGEATSRAPVAGSGVTTTRGSGCPPHRVRFVLDCDDREDAPRAAQPALDMARVFVARTPRVATVSILPPVRKRLPALIVRSTTAVSNPPKGGLRAALPYQWRNSRRSFRRTPPSYTVSFINGCRYSRGCPSSRTTNRRNFYPIGVWLVHHRVARKRCRWQQITLPNQGDSLNGPLLRGDFAWARGVPE